MEQNETRTLWISIGSAIFAVILLYGWAQDKRASLARTFGQTKTVVVAREDIREFEILDESKLEVVERPSEFIQPSAMQNPTEIVGQIALAPIKKGDTVGQLQITLNKQVIETVPVVALQDDPKGSIFRRAYDKVAKLI